MNKKVLALGIVGTVGMAGAMLIPLAVSADTNTNTVVSTFVEKLAAKLNVDQSTLQTAVDSVRSDIKTEMDAKINEELATAVTEGKLTQRQADILTAIHSVQLGGPDQSNRPDPSTFENLTQEERQAQREQMHAERLQSTVDKLNESGINTTTEELEAAQEAARSAGIRVGGFGGMGERGMRMGGGFGMGI